MAQPAWDRQHLLGLEGLSAADIRELIEAAESYGDVAAGRGPRLNLLAGQTIANLFFEDSTRTRCSFTLAARRLGADTLDLTSAGSSVRKGETIVDTALNLHAMGVSGFVVRCAAEGGPHMIARALQDGAVEGGLEGGLEGGFVINAGDGKHEHPTQALLDIMTLIQRLGELRGRTVAIVGDIAASRVARSNVHGLTTLGANVMLIGPPSLAPRAFEKIAAGPGRVNVSHDFDNALPALDAIMMLRVQFERSEAGHAAIAGDYRQLYGLTAERAARLPEHAIILHPGPMNRGLEIDSEVADDPKRSVILQQVRNGVAVRMAVMAALAESS